MNSKSATFRSTNTSTTDGTLSKIRKKFTGFRRHSVAEDLPDGSFSPRKFPSAPVSECITVVEEPIGFESDPNDPEFGVAPVKYVGSFLVIGDGQPARINYVQNQLETMQSVFHDKPVLLVVCLAGIKVCSTDGKIIHMAHALKRISYATCNPEQNQFAFLAREPRHNYNVQYCHVFRTGCPEQAMEINGVVGNAFRSATERKLAGQTCLDESFPIDKSLECQTELDLIQKPEKSGNNSIYNRSFTDTLDQIKDDHKIVINVVRPLVPDEADSKFNSQQFDVDKKPMEENNSEVQIDLTVPELEPNNQYETVDTLRNNCSIPTSCEEKRPIPPVSPPPPSPLTAYQSGRVVNPFEPLILLQAGVDQKLTNPSRLTPEIRTTDDLSSFYRPKNSINRSRRPQSCQLPTSLAVGWVAKSHPAAIPEEIEVSNAASMIRKSSSTEKPTVLRRFLNRMRSATNLFDRNSTDNGEKFRSDVKSASNISLNSYSNPTATGAATQLRQDSSLRSGLSFPSLRENLKLPNFPVGKKRQRQRPLSELFINTTATVGPSSSTANRSNDKPLQTALVSSVRPVMKREGFRQAQISATKSLFLDQNCLNTTSTTPLSQNAFDSGFDLSCRSSLTGSSLGSCSEGISPISTEDFRRVCEAEWYCGGVNRALVTEVLKREPVGSFVVRQSSQPGCFALSVRVPQNLNNNSSDVSHYLILHTANGGYKLKGFTKEFPSVHSLVTHHSILAEQLPCRLIFTRRPRDSWAPQTSPIVDSRGETVASVELQFPPSQIDPVESAYGVISPNLEVSLS